MNAKERDKKERQVRRAKKRKGIEAQRVKHPTTSQDVDGLIGDEEQIGKQKSKKKKKERVPNNSVSSHHVHGSYGELILASPPPSSQG